MEQDTGEQNARNKADFVTGLVFAILGAVVFWASYTMPRLENRRIDPSTIPGLVPMGLGAALCVLGALLAVRAWRLRGKSTPGSFFAIFRTIEAARVAAALGMVLIFTLVLVGWLPFWAASALFLFVFIVVMEGVLVRTPRNIRRILLWASLTAAVAGGGIYYVFSELFLVRLP